MLDGGLRPAPAGRPAGRVHAAGPGRGFAAGKTLADFEQALFDRGNRVGDAQPDVVVRVNADRAAKMRAAKIRPLTPTAASDYVARAERDLRRQTVGIGVDVIRVGNTLLIRIPATLTNNCSP